MRRLCVLPLLTWLLPAGASAVVAQTPTAAPTSSARCLSSGQDDLIVNGGFESGDLRGWQSQVDCCSPNPACILPPETAVKTPGPENGHAGEVGTCGLFNYVPCGNYSAVAFSGADFWCTGPFAAELSQEFEMTIPVTLKFLYAGVLQSYWKDRAAEAYVEFEVSVRPPAGGSWQSVWYRTVHTYSADARIGLECFYSIPHYVPWTEQWVDLCRYAGWRGRLRARALSSVAYPWIECSMGYLDQVRTEGCKQARLDIYNGAGERVRGQDLPVEALPKVPADLSLSPNPFSPDGDGVDDVMEIRLDDGQKLVWDGKNDRGRVVDNGGYLVRLTVYDVFGVEQGQVSRQARVAAKGNELTCAVYDLAGNHVATLDQIRAPYRVRDVEILPNPFTPGTRNKAWNTLLVRIYGSIPGVATPTPPPGALPPPVAVCTWRGQDGAGNLVTNGTYWLRVTNVDSDGNRTEIARSLVILHGRFSLLSDLRVYPNPYAPEKGVLQFSYEPNIPQAPHVTVSVYDVQGQLVARRTSALHGGPDPNLPAGAPGRFRVTWDGLNFARKYAAEGVYLAVLSVVDPETGTHERVRYKFAVTRRKP